MKTPTNLNEANRLHLEVTFLCTAAEAEARAATMVRNGRNVVAVFEETLAGASLPSFLVCVSPQVHVLGPLGLERKKS